MRSCREPRCPNPATDGGYCAKHKRPPRTPPQRWGKDKRTTKERGYGDPEWSKKRLRTIWRDKVCCFCGGSLLDEHNRPVKGATCHHILPKKQGGSDDDTNLTACHADCHRQHHAKR